MVADPVLHPPSHLAAHPEALLMLGGPATAAATAGMTSMAGKTTCSAECALGVPTVEGVECGTRPCDM